MKSKSGYHILILLAILQFSTKPVLSQSYYSLEFIENKGQWGDQFQYRADVGNGVFFLQKNGFTVLQHNESDYKRVMELMHGHDHQENGNISKESAGPDGIHSKNESTDRILRSHAYRVTFAGSAPNPQVTGEKLVGSTANYFIGKDPSKWKTGVRSYQVMTYKNIYPNIDVRYYSDGGRLKYDIVAYPGADISRILLKYDGAEKLSVKNGQLIIKTSVGETKELSPYTFQIINGKKEEIGCQYQVKGNQVSFSVKNYNRNEMLVIDPTLVFGTFTGSRTSNWGFTATPGPDGSFFAGGIVFGTGYPISVGAFQSNFGGGSGSIDMGITRFSPTGNSRIYSTYLGGTGEDLPHSLISDAQGNLVVLGRTTSPDYPTTGTNYGLRGGTDIVVTKLNAAGTALIGSVVMGGTGTDGANMNPDISPTCNSLLYNYGDNARSEVILDAANNIYIASSTQSSNFPVVGGVQATRGGAQDAVVVKLTPNLNALMFSTYLGGNADDAGFVLKINPVNGNIYVAGATSSPNFPGNKVGSIQPNFQGGAGDIDGYIAILSNDGSTLIRSTFLGTPAIDIIYGIQFDRNGFPYVMGITLGNWPVVNAAYVNAGSKQFISKLQANLSAYVYSTVYGSANSVPNISPVAFLVDRCENVYVSGWGGRLNPCSSTSCFDSKTSGTQGMPVTPDAIKTTTDNRDFYFFVMQRDAVSQLYGSFIGQTGGEGDHVDGGTSRFDTRGAIYQAVCANCGGNNACASSPITVPFPVTPGVVAPVNGALNSGTSGECNLAALKIAFDFDGVSTDIQSSINGVVDDSSGCVPLKVDFEDILATAQTYTWDFGDGSPRVTTTTASISHTYTTVGTYQVKLIATDNTKCIPLDSSFISIAVRNDQAVMDLASIKLPPCESLAYRFDNLSTAPPGKPFTGNIFTWDFGDNTPRVVTGSGPVNHTYAAPGTYNVKLILSDTSYCNGPDSIVRTVRLSPLVEAQFETPPTGCVPYTAVIENTSLAGQTFRWDFGDGTTFTGANPPPKLYPNAGTYTITLIADDPTTCNLTDTSRQTITVNPNPTAGFNFSPNPPEENTPTSFTNASFGAVRYFWSFGDGDTSILINPVHQFNATGNFQTCLVAYNQFGCADTVCQEVSTIVVPLLDVPNAFTPNGDGINDKVFVRGFGIARMTFKIYNRWGQLVFQSADPLNGWDGRFKGVLQPMDSYGYTLEVEFSTGARSTKKGDITLVR